MAHFGVKKAKKVAVAALATVAAVGGAALSYAPTYAATSVTIDDITVEMDGTMPALKEDANGVPLTYDTTYDNEVDITESTIHKLKSDEHFACSRDFTNSNIILKDAAGFKAFTSSLENAKKMRDICDSVIYAQYAGTYTDSTTSFDSSNLINFLITNGSGNEYTVDTDLVYDENGDGTIDYSFEVEDSTMMTIVGQPMNNNGNVRLRIKPLKAGEAQLNYTKDGTTKHYIVRIADFTYKDNDGRVYYNFKPARYTNEFMLVKAYYIGTEDINLPDHDAYYPVDINFGAEASSGVNPTSAAKAVTGTNDPVSVDVNVKLKSLDLDITVREGSKVSFEGELDGNVHVRDAGSKMTFEEGTTQPDTQRVMVDATSGAELVFNGGDYDDILINGATKDTLITINGGSYKQKAVAATAETDSLIRSCGTVTINDGMFEHEVKALDGDADEPDAIWHNDTHALIHVYNTASGDKTIRIKNGTFRTNGTVFSAEQSYNQDSSGARFIIDDGDFEAKHMMAIANGWNGITTINGGTFNTYDRFYVWDVLNGWECNEPPFEDSALGAVARSCNADGDETRRDWGTGVQGGARVLVEPDLNHIVVKGGDFSDGADTDGSGVQPASGYYEVKLDTDYDNDGRKDVRVLPERVYSTSVGLYEEKAFNVPDGFQLIAQTNDACSVRFENGQVIIKGLKVTGGETANFCKFSISDKESRVDTYSVSVVDNNDYKDGEPISLSEGDSVTPDDTTKNPEDYDWTVVDGNEYCTVSDSGVITAIKGGGKCTIVARDPEADPDNDNKHEVITWEVTTTNPIDMNVGDTVKPDDLPDGADDGEWSSDDTNVCTVSADGVITAKKAGTCHVTLTLEDGTIYTWTVNIKENPNTLDKRQAMTFSIAGAAIAGLGAMIAVAKRFIRR